MGYPILNIVPNQIDWAFLSLEKNMHLYATCRSRCNKSSNNDITPFNNEREHYVVSTELGLCLIEQFYGHISYRFVINRRDYFIKIRKAKWKYKYIINITQALMYIASEILEYDHNCVYKTDFTNIYKIGT